MDDIKTFVLLKYKIITSDYNTWHLCNTYPEEVKVKWRWRCADNIAHLAKGVNVAENCIRIANQYRYNNDPKIQIELREAWEVALGDLGAPYWVSRAHVYIKSTMKSVQSSVFANDPEGDDFEKVWDLYISWLVEELCEYESRNHE